jgi:hypothetical protein
MQLVHSRPSPLEAGTPGAAYHDWRASQIARPLLACRSRQLGEELALDHFAVGKDGARLEGTGEMPCLDESLRNTPQQGGPDCQLPALVPLGMRSSQLAADDLCLHSQRAGRMIANAPPVGNALLEKLFGFQLTVIEPPASRSFGSALTDGDLRAPGSGPRG